MSCKLCQCNALLRCRIIDRLIAKHGFKQSEALTKALYAATFLVNRKQQFRA